MGLGSVVGSSGVGHDAKFWSFGSSGTLAAWSGFKIEGFRGFFLKIGLGAGFSVICPCILWRKKAKLSHLNEFWDFLGVCLRRP
ncbi:MAG: hypothetical protein E2O41_00195 [Nitrospina sp.]|nr:MAG: hypothetical protein E2O41_00195 [Nitrospina sp.]